MSLDHQTDLRLLNEIETLTSELKQTRAELEEAVEIITFQAHNMPMSYPTEAIILRANAFLTKHKE